MMNQMNQKTNFDNNNAPVPVVSVMFVPYTPHSQLLNKLKKVESNITKITRDKIQHVERAGTKLRFLLVTSDPWSNSKCQSPKCLVCSNPFNSTQFSCRKRNVSY